MQTVFNILLTSVNTSRVSEMLSALLVLLPSVLSSEACTGQPPTIVASSSSSIGNSSRSHNGNRLILITREPITLFCTGEDSKNLRVCSNGHCLELEQINPTTVKHWIQTPNLEPTTYTCSSKTCEDHVTVIIRPSVSLASRNLHWTIDTAGRRIYFVPYGDPYEVFCSCYEGTAVYLESSYDSAEMYKKSVSVNRTTIRHTARADRIKEFEYWCVNGNNGNIISPQVIVVVDLPVEAREFQCISYQERQIVCAWRSETMMNSYKLFFSSVHAQSYIAPRILCSDSPGVITRSCSWNNVLGYERPYRRLHGGDFTLLLESCNQVYCANQTFVINLRSITKLDPPSAAKLLRSSARGASISWHLPVWLRDIKLHFKLQYRLLGTDWRQINSSSVQCSYSEAFFCESRLPLPCPDVHYEVRVFVKLQAAKEEKHWSDPVSIFFYTEPADDGGGRECDAEFRESEPPPSATVVLFKIRQLISFERKAKSELKRKLKALKKKRARAEALMEWLAAHD